MLLGEREEVYGLSRVESVDDKILDLRGCLHPAYKLLVLVDDEPYLCHSLVKRVLDDLVGQCPVRVSLSEPDKACVNACRDIFPSPVVRDGYLSFLRFVRSLVMP